MAVSKSSRAVGTTAAPPPAPGAPSPKSDGYRMPLALSLAAQIAPRGERAEVVVTILVVAVVFAMLLPIPTWLLDLLIAVNLCMSALLIVLVLQVQKTTGLSAFPSLFLVTTLFRVAISVASTRQILLNAEAGHIITAFGEIVVGGNLVVGLVIFLVLTAVQFIVITKGSERVAEVGARFSLDAMPGRQMAIDMERKSGVTTQEEARAQRDALTEESQFFGAMDGTMKFAKGDSIVGIVIVLVNLIGGLAIGMLQRGMEAGQALQLYAILTVGDGLVAQIPALLMSLAAGLLVTRVAKPTGGHNIGTELTSQLLAQPKAWVTASGAMVAFGMLPGMPLLAFATLALASATVGLTAMARNMRKKKDAERAVATGLQESREFSVVRPFLLRLSDRLSPEVAAKAVQTCRSARNALVTRLGLVTPPIYADEGQPLEDADVEFCHGEVRVFALWLNEDLRTFSWIHDDGSGFDLPATQVEIGAGLAGSVRLWMDEAAVAQLSPTPFDVQDVWTRLNGLTIESLMRYGPSYFGIEETQKIVAWTVRGAVELGKELDRALPVSRMTEVFRRLLGERVSVRNLPVILNSLIEWGPRERDPAVLTECIRAALQREICESYAVRRELRVLMLDSEFESLIRGAIRQTSYGDFLSLDAETTDGILDELSASYLSVMDGHGQVVLLCAQDIRSHVRRLLADRIPELGVIGLSELPPEYRVNVRAVVSLPERVGEGAEMY
ncbi:type III secretion system export apparatus subunit SctV [Roseateles amylovorans]|uniref:Type III secretion system export apparatus subunit SctV n=1 Tax=Roseateles amylovorans TaxID=2978473 RepID=A0ABY6B2W0_9BURK|nr:type III secretion system export apparatus subunit SctV [Roseateles amylovorans]UXH79524.1 type III secretion system export apparatus subunit SctV [Roseateles amylovorans]